MGVGFGTGIGFRLGLGLGVREAGAHDAGPHGVVRLEHTGVGDGGAGCERRLDARQIDAVAAHLVRVRVRVKGRGRGRDRVIGLELGLEFGLELEVG